MRSVFASTIRLWALADERGDTSPFLHGFAPPLYLPTMTDEEARSLLRQEHLPEPARPALEPEVSVTSDSTREREQILWLFCRRRQLPLSPPLPQSHPAPQPRSRSGNWCRTNGESVFVLSC